MNFFSQLKQSDQHPQQKFALKALLYFFALMLFFTIISRIADGFTIAKVSVSQVKEGIIKDELSITGKIVAQGDESISVRSGLKIDKVYVQPGQSVTIDDPLLLFDLENIDFLYTTAKNELDLLNLQVQSIQLGTDASANTALVTAQKNLENTNYDYEQVKIEGQIKQTRSDEDLSEVKKLYEDTKKEYDTICKEAYTNRLEKTTKAYEDAKRERDKGLLSLDYSAAERAIEDAQMQFDETQRRYRSALDQLAAAEESGDATAIETATKALKEAQIQYDNATTRLKRAKEDLEKVEDTYSTSQSDLTKKVDTTKKEWENAKNNTDVSKEPTVIAAKSILDSSQKNIKTLERNLEDTIRSKEQQLRTAQRSIDNAMLQLQQAQQQAIKDQSSGQLDENKQKVELHKLKLQLQEKEKEVGILSALIKNQGVLRSSIIGRILSVQATVGDKTTDTELLSIARSDEGFLFKGKVSEKQAEKLDIGSEMRITTEVNGKQESIISTISSMGILDEDRMIEITCVLPEGAYKPDGSAKMESNEEGKDYRMCLPISALRNDDSGDFVYIVQEVESVMGNEVTAVRMPITILDRDRDNMAIEGGFQGDTQIIVSSNKPLEVGDRIRLILE